MKVVSMSVAPVLLLLSQVLAQSPAEDQKKAEQYIAESERQWAESVATGSTDELEKILADDFGGVDPEGVNIRKAK